MTVHPLLRRQLSEAFGGEPPETPELHALITAVNRTYTTAGDDRHVLEDSLGLAFDNMVERNAEMALILDNVSQGFITAKLDGSLGQEHSRTLVRWLGPAPADGKLWSYLAGGDADLAAWIQLGFDGLVDPAMTRELVLEQLPRRIERAGLQLRIDYQPLGEPWTAILVMVSDITDEVARERAEAAQRELLAILERAARDRAGVAAFVRETNALVRHGERGGIALPELLRRLHTLKGNAGLLGATTIAELCHELETAIERDGAAPNAAAWKVLRDAWQPLHDQIDQLLDVSERRVVVVDWDEYQEVLAQIGDIDAAWAQRMRNWGRDATRPQLQRFADRARELAHLRGVAELDVEIRDHDLRVDGDRLAPVWSAMIHAIHNAVDHGIQPAETRIAAGKPARGKLVLSSELRGGDLILEVSDDGAGIDWRAVAERAGELGLPTSSKHDLHDAVFANGLSTAGEVTHSSGRGVGLGALYDACAALGGRVELTSELGRGTTVRCIVPLAWPRSRARTSSAAR